MNLEKRWKRGRFQQASKILRARDIILHCRDQAKDVTFAKKYNLTVQTVRKIRLGHSWKQLRQKLES